MSQLLETILRFLLKQPKVTIKSAVQTTEVSQSRELKAVQGAIRVFIIFVCSLSIPLEFFGGKMNIRLSKARALAYKN